EVVPRHNQVRGWGVENSSRQITHKLRAKALRLRAKQKARAGVLLLSHLEGVQIVGGGEKKRTRSWYGRSVGHQAHLATWAIRRDRVTCVGGGDKNVTGRGLCRKCICHVCKRRIQR